MKLMHSIAIPERMALRWLPLLLTLILAGCQGSEQAIDSSGIPAIPDFPTAPGYSYVAEVVEIPPVEVSALTEIRERGVLRVGALYDEEPFSYLARSGSLDGYEVALVQRVAEAWSIPVEFVQVTRQTRLEALASGEIDMLIGRFVLTREGEAQLEFSQSVFPGGIGVLVRGDSDIESLSQLAGRSVATLGDEAAGLVAELAAGGVSMNAQPLNRSEAGPALGEARTVDALVGPMEDLLFVQSTLSEVRVLPEQLRSEPVVFALRNGDTPLRDLLNLTLSGIFSDAGFGELYAFYFFGISARPSQGWQGAAAYDFGSFPVALSPREPTLERMRRGEPLRVAGMELNPTPPAFSSSPILDGFNQAMINEVARRWNVPIIEIPASSGNAGLELLRSGQADLMVGAAPDLGQIGQVVYSQPLYEVGLRLAYLEDNPASGVGDLDFNRTVIFEPLALSRDLVEDNNAFPRIVEAATIEDAFRDLVGANAKALVGDEYSISLIAQADERIDIEERLYRPSVRSLALPAGDPDFEALLAFTIQDMYRDGTLDRLYEQYLRPYQPEDADRAPLPLVIWPGSGAYLGFGQS